MDDGVGGWKGEFVVVVGTHIVGDAVLGGGVVHGSIGRGQVPDGLRLGELHRRSVWTGIQRR